VNPTNPSPSRTALVVAFAAIYLIWGSTYLGIRVAVESMPPFAMASARFLVAGVLLFGFLKIRGAPWPTARQWRINAGIGTFLLLGGNGLVTYAEQVVPSGITALLIGVAPLFFVLIEWAWPGGTRPTAVTFGALLLGFFGVFWLAAPWESAAQSGLNLAGALTIIGSTVFWATGSIYSRRAKHGLDPLVASSLQMLTGGVALALVGYFHRDFAHLDLAGITLWAWLAFAYLVVIGSLVGFSTYVWLVKHSTPARVSTYAYVNPVVAVFLGWLLLGEAINPRTIVSSIIIVTAVVIVTVQKNQPAAAPVTTGLKASPADA
jgi:drug/metabolite transporter (DMT)-like permease